MEENWSMKIHTKASPTDAYGIIDFQDTATRVCRAKYVRVAVDSKPEALLQLMLREWQMERPKLLLTVQGGSENFVLPPKVKQAFSKGLINAALSTGAWILTDGINTGYRLSLIDMGLVIEYLIGGAYRSTYTRKNFRAAYSQTIPSFSAPLPCPFNFNDLFVWAVLQQRQQMALFLWQHGEEALARAVVACKLYRSMAFEARQSNMDDNIAERFKTFSLEFGQLAVDMLDCAFQQNEQMAMKLLTSEMEAAEEMCPMVVEISEKVNFIQLSLSELDSQLGQLQDLSALAVDTLTLLSASDSLHHKEAHLAQCQLARASRHTLPHSWTLPHRSDFDGAKMQGRMVKACKSTPPSLLKCSALMGCKECRQGKHGHSEAAETSKEDSQCSDLEHPSENWLGGPRPVAHTSFSPFSGGGVHFAAVRNQMSFDSSESSRCGSPLSPRSLGSPHKPWTCDSYLYPNQEESSVEEEGGDDETEEKEKEMTQKQLSNIEDESQQSFQSKHSSHWRRPAFPPRWALRPRDRPYGFCRSLSSSMENVTFSGAPLSPKRKSFPSLNETINECLSGQRGFRDDTSLHCSRSQEWDKSSDFTPVLDSRGKNRKMVKIQESTPDTTAMSWRKRQRFVGEPTCWSASTSLSQLNFDPTDLIPKQMFSHQDIWSPTHSAWNSWAKTMSRRSSVQSSVVPEAKSPSFQSTDHLYPHFSAMERNNLMRLAHTIPFPPVSVFGGEEVSVYSLEEAPSDSADPEFRSVMSWSSRGHSAMLQPLSSEEGSLDGGIRKGCRMLCTWAEQDVLKPGMVYIVKAFKPEVVRAWQKYFHGSAALQLCLREIQQQRAAQKMMQVFNQIKPDDLHHSPRFLDVSLVLWHSNGQWLTIERNLTGDFRKYNNNTGEEIAPCCSLEDMLLAFSHWTYEYSCRELMVLDIQGVGEELTDPTVITADDQSGSRGEMVFGPDNLGDAAIKGFLQKHSCNFCCLRLGLKDLRKRPGSCESSSEEERLSDQEERDGD
uniref:Transient receptor potential cation channel, subfamily M, member 6 n=1 Tax=Iconisemion striatum TaxID=60296 RepID=A0A1A7W9D3_9TELE